MKTLTQLTTIPGTYGSVSRALAVLAISLVLTTASQAVPITGDPLPPGTWVPNSSNALNYDKLVPGREGQNAPYVLFNSNTGGSVTLDFFNLGPGLAFFETRIDGVATGATAHPVVIGDTIHAGGTSVSSGNTVLGKTFVASEYVDIRLALGGERDWDFDWVRFEVAPSASVPDAGGTLALLGLGLAGIGFARRRK